MLSGNMWKLNYLRDDLLANEVAINSNVLGSHIKHWIIGSPDCTCVIGI